MAVIAQKKMNWAPTMSAYDSVTSWRAKRQVAQQEFEGRNSAITSVLTTAWDDEAYAAGELAAKKAGARIAEESKAQQEKLAKLTAAGDNDIPSTKNSVFTTNGSTTLDGGTRIDLNSSTLTLSDGTLIDLKTGLKKLNVVV